MTNYTPGGQTYGNSIGDLFALFQQNQMTPAQSLATAIPAFNYTRNLNQYMQPAQTAANAIIDITSPEYQRIYAQQKQQGQQNLADQIAELSAQNRKLAMLGRVPLFNPERGGEQIFRNMTRGYQDIQNQAANQTQDILGRSFQTQQMLGQQRQQNAATKSSTTGNILGAVAKLFGL